MTFLENDVNYTTAASPQHLQGILKLQGENLESALDLKSAVEQGFVTLKHDFNLLNEMNQIEPHVIALQGEHLAGYALVMTLEIKDRIPALNPMFEVLEGLNYRGRAVSDYRYFIMGQVCVDRAFRGRGVFRGLYEKMRELYASDYDLVITEVARRNQRSAKAHEHVGFELIHRYRDDRGEEWDLILWDWAGQLKASP